VDFKPGYGEPWGSSPEEVRKISGSKSNFAPKIFASNSNWRWEKLRKTSGRSPEDKNQNFFRDGSREA
jgi:hypothetical protein